MYFPHTFVLHGVGERCLLKQRAGTEKGEGGGRGGGASAALPVSLLGRHLLREPRGCVRQGVRHEASLHHDATPATPMDVRKLCDHIINLHSLKAQ